MSEILNIIGLLIIIFVIVLLLVCILNKGKDKKTTKIEVAEDVDNNSEDNTQKRIIPDNVHAEEPTTVSTQNEDSKVYTVNDNNVGYDDIDKVVRDEK